MSAVFKITGAAVSSNRTCRESRNRHQKQVGSRRQWMPRQLRQCHQYRYKTVQSLSLTILSPSSRCRFHVAVMLSLSLHRFRSNMNGNCSQRLGDFNLAILIAWVSHDNHGGAHLNDAYAGTPECWRRSQKPGDSYQTFPPPTKRLACETRCTAGEKKVRLPEKVGPSVFTSIRDRQKFDAHSFECS